MYECALVTMILVFAIIVIVHVIIPYYFKWKAKRMINKSNERDSSVKQNKSANINEQSKVTQYFKKMNFNFNRIKLLYHYGAT
jgi:predicted membrane protein